MSSPALIADLRLLALGIVSSPRRTRELHGDWRDWLAAAAWAREPLRVFDSSALRDAVRVLSRLGGTALSLRSGGAAVGGHRFPDASAVVRLLGWARQDLAAETPWMRVGLAGLCVLVIHPLTDGNGRLARLVWLGGMMGQGLSIREAVASLDAWYGVQGVAALPLFDAAVAGDLAPFRRRWLALSPVRMPDALADDVRDIEAALGQRDEGAVRPFLPFGDVGVPAT